MATKKNSNQSEPTLAPGGVPGTVSESAPHGKNADGQRLTASGRVMRDDLDPSERLESDVNNRGGRAVQAIESVGRIPGMPESAANRLCDLLASKVESARKRLLAPSGSSASAGPGLADSILSDDD